jgi:hypothetical protein
MNRSGSRCGSPLRKHADRHRSVTLRPEWTPRSA